MFIGVISDTHGHVELTQTALRLLRPFQLAHVIHCGDLGSAELVPLFAEWTTHFVFGNVDRDESGLRESIERAGQTCHGREGQLNLEGQRVSFLHGDDVRRLGTLIRSEESHLVCHGHTHEYACYERGATMVLNPGAVYRANPHSVAVVELPSRTVHQLRF